MPASVFGGINVPAAPAVFILFPVPRLVLHVFCVRESGLGSLLLVKGRERAASPLSSVHRGSLAGKARSFDLLLALWRFQKKERSIRIRLLCWKLVWQWIGVTGASKMQFTATKPGPHWNSVQIESSQPAKKKCSYRKKCFFIAWRKALLGGPRLRAERAYGFPFASLKELTLFLPTWKCWTATRAQSTPSLASSSKCRDLLEQCQWASPPLSKFTAS